MENLRILKMWTHLERLGRSSTKSEMSTEGPSRILKLWQDKKQLDNHLKSKERKKKRKSITMQLTRKWKEDKMEKKGKNLIFQKRKLRELQQINKQLFLNLNQKVMEGLSSKQ